VITNQESEALAKIARLALENWLAGQNSNLRIA
jgi:hypothetical protein